MIHYYHIDESSIQKSSEKDANWISLVDLSDNERMHLSLEFGLAENNLKLNEYYFTPAEFKKIDSAKNSSFLSLELNHLEKGDDSVSDRLTKFAVLMDEEVIITVSEETDEPFHRAFESAAGTFNSYNYTGAYILYLQNQYIKELEERKATMDQIHARAKRSMKSEILEELTNIEQDFIYIDHVVTNEKEVLEEWLEIAAEEENLIAPKLKIRLEEKMNVVQTMVRLYRELQESTEDLISSIMDNRLNNIMEQLTSISIILAVPTLIYSLFGINTGGLWGVNNEFGSLIVIVVSILLGVLTYIYLKKKDYLE